jgi:Sigma-70, region 4
MVSGRCGQQCGNVSDASEPVVETPSLPERDPWRRAGGLTLSGRVQTQGHPRWHDGGHVGRLAHRPHGAAACSLTRTSPPRLVGKQGRPFAADLPGIERRNAEMVRRYTAGENLARIGASLGVTRERVRQVVKQSGAPMPWEYQCAVDGCCTSPRSPRAYCSRHQLRLERYGPAGHPTAAPRPARHVQLLPRRRLPLRPRPHRRCSNEARGCAPNASRDAPLCAPRPVRRR